MSLTDGTSKMSKSDPVEASRINLTDPPDVITKKVRTLVQVLFAAAVACLLYHMEVQLQACLKCVYYHCQPFISLRGFI